VSEPTVLLSDILDVERLERLVADRLVSRRRHPSAPLVIYDYTTRASYARAWTTETRLCRGLIADDGGRVVARPFPKFFTYDEHLLDPSLGGVPGHARFEVYDKVDGSLGILYRWGDELAIATRGSFSSDQALWATEHLRARYADVSVPPGVTYLLEIVYPANRIVVDYGPFAGLVMLASIDIATGADLPLPADWPGPVVARQDSSTTLVELADLCREAPDPTVEREGFVVRFAAPDREPSLRVKLKFAEYIRLHRLLTGVSSRTIWERLSTGATLDDLLDRVPDEFAHWVQDTARGLRDSYACIERECRAVLAELGPHRAERARRAGAAERFRASGANTAVLFKMLDGQPYDQIIWRAVRPAGQQQFRTDVEP
jgi:RNA ligase